MKLTAPLITIKERLISFISEGYVIIGLCFENKQDTSIQGKLFFEQIM